MPTSIIVLLVLLVLTITAGFGLISIAPALITSAVQILLTILLLQYLHHILKTLQHIAATLHQQRPITTPSANPPQPITPRPAPKPIHHTPRTADGRILIP